jgi:deazaflavin-dependent oxidoreductase (nitroreductase family)
VSNYSETIDQSGVIDITTTGARTGKQRRIEINFVHLDGRYYITGRPWRKRDWQANLRANPEFMVHLKGDKRVDIPATARLITEEDERSDVLYRILIDGWDNDPGKARHILPEWVERSPLVEFTPALEGESTRVE